MRKKIYSFATSGSFVYPKTENNQNKGNKTMLGYSARITSDSWADFPLLFLLTSFMPFFGIIRAYYLYIRK